MTEPIRLCPECGSGDVRFCSISARPYCNDCKYWGPVNFGRVEDAIAQWNKRLDPTSFISTLTPTQLQSAINYQGPDTLGPVKEQQMTPRDFCLWLQGFLRDDYAIISTKDVDTLRKKLDSVFIHETYVEPKTPTKPQSERPRC